MSEKRLSEIMSDSSRAIADAQDVLDEAITNAIHIHFDAGVTFERERIINELNQYHASLQRNGLTQAAQAVLSAIDFIKGEDK